nr:MAG TPA: hypothetical protein [Caudoviricetes sp.]
MVPCRSAELTYYERFVTFSFTLKLRKFEQQKEM